MNTVPRRGSLAVESLLFAQRLFTRWLRYPTVPIQSVLFPTFFLITYHLLVGKSMVRITGANSLDALVPVCAVAGGMFGAIGASLTIQAERDSGVLSRWWTLPVHRASALTGRLVADAARTLLSVAVVTAVGLALGLDFHGGWLGLIAFLLVPVLVVTTFAMIVIGLSVRAKGVNIFAWLATSCVGLVFSSAGVAPLEKFPHWMRPIVKVQPMSPTIQAMRDLIHGDAAQWPLLATLAWVVGLAAVMAPFALRGYRAAAEQGAAPA